MKKKIMSLCLVAMMGLMTGCGNSDDGQDNINEITEEVAKSTRSTEVHNTEEPQMKEMEGTLDAADYSVCTEYSNVEVESFALEIKQQILDGDWNGLSEKIAYPITIGEVEYADAKEFASADWNTILSKDFITAIENESCQNMFCNYEGIMFGDGQIWFSQVMNEVVTPEEAADSSRTGTLKITAINITE